MVRSEYHLNTMAGRRTRSPEREEESLIKFIKHRATKDYKVKSFEIKKGDEILKICFTEKDIHKSRLGKLHLDIWGKKLEQLGKILEK